MPLDGLAQIVVHISGQTFLALGEAVTKLPQGRLRVAESNSHGQMVVIFIQVGLNCINVPLANRSDDQRQAFQQSKAGK